MCFSKKQSKKLTWTHPDFDNFKKELFLGVGPREIEKSDFPEIEKITRVANGSKWR